MRLRTCASQISPRAGSVIVLFSLIACGCTSPLFRGQSPEIEAPDEFSESAEYEEELRLVGDYAVPFGTNWQRVEGIALCTRLAGTGSDPPPSPGRDQLIKEMQTHEVKSYSTALASDDTAMVLVRGLIPPGAKKGDTFDIEIRVPPRSKTTSIEGGWLMQSRLREHQKVGSSVHVGHVDALAKGPIVADIVFDDLDEEIAKNRGRILGGGIVQRPRQMGLYISEELSSVKTSATIGAAINQRFHHFDHGSKKGVANPTRDNMIELAVHPRYKNNLRRYLQVIRNIAVGETATERVARLGVLERMLMEPTSAEKAALQLEAIGEEATDVLRRGVKSEDAEVRFYAAEALAYLDDPDASVPLVEAAGSERAFRWRALSALATLNSFQAQEGLIDLTSAPSAETRYGAFRALRERNSRDPLVRGEILANEFGLHVLTTKGEPMIHFARSRRPEIVLFGHDQHLRPPAFLFAGPRILIKGDGDSIRLSRFRPNQEDEHVKCSTRLDDVIRNIVKMGGGYSDVFRAIESAKSQGYLTARLEVDALPRQGRRFKRDSGEPIENVPTSNTPLPEMFVDRLSTDDSTADESSDVIPVDYEEEGTEDGIFAKIGSWFSVAE